MTAVKILNIIKVIHLFDSPESSILDQTVPLKSAFYISASTHKKHVK